MGGKLDSSDLEDIMEDAGLSQCCREALRKANETYVESEGVAVGCDSLEGETSEREVRLKGHGSPPRIMKNYI